MGDIAAAFRDILVFHLGADERRLTENARLLADLAADSFDIFEIVIACEEKFGIEIPNAAVTDFVTVGDFVDYIEAKVRDSKPRLFDTATIGK